jgi:hypothetical protein
MPNFSADCATAASLDQKGLKEDRNVAGSCLKSFGLIRPIGNQNIGLQRHEFSRQLRKARKVTVA